MGTFLLGGAMRDDRRPDDFNRDHADQLWRTGTRHLEVRNELLGGRPAATAVLLGPRDADEACVVDVPLPLAQHGDPRIQLVGQVLWPQAVAGEEGPHFVADLLLLFVERELHADSLTSIGLV